MEAHYSKDIDSVVISDKEGHTVIIEPQNVNYLIKQLSNTYVDRYMYIKSLHEGYH